MKRKKFPNPKEINLASAFPNEGYVYHECIRTVILKAFLKGGKVTFFEVDDRITDQPRRIPEKTVKSLFPMDKTKKQRPFTKKGNEKFYAVLHRNRQRYKATFENLCQTKTKQS